MPLAKEETIRFLLGVSAVLLGLISTGCGADDDSARQAVAPAAVADCLDETNLRIDRAESTDLAKPQADLIGYYPYPSKAHRVVISFYRSERMAQLVEDPEFDREYGFVSRTSNTPTAAVSYSNDLPAEAVSVLEDCVDLESDDSSLALDSSTADGENDAEQIPNVTTADLLAGSEMVWGNLDGPQKAAVVREFMNRFGRKYPMATSKALKAQAEDNHLSGTFASIDTGQTLQQALRFMAQLVESDEIFKAKSKYLPTREVLGMTSAEVAQKLGPPDREQDISGVGVMWYYNLKDNMFQLIFSNDVVTTVNKY